MKEKPSWLLILILSLVKFILPFILQSPVFELQRDEYLYFEQGQHPALGYLENPPLLSYLGIISSWMGGEFGVRLVPSLIGAGTLIFTCLIAYEFGGKTFAQFLAGFGIITGAYLRIHSLFQPNIVDILCWTVCIYFLVRFLKTHNEKFFYAVLITLSIGWWSKYSIIFLAAGIFVSLLVSNQRKIFLQRKTWIVLLIAFILVLPNVWWQYDHNWPLVHHMRELQETQLQYLSPADFLKDQILYLVPVLIIWVAGLIWLFRKKEFRLLAWTYLLVIFLLMIGRGKSYYSMGIYPMLLAAGGVAWEKFSRQRLWMRPVLIVLITLLVLPFIPLLLPIWEPAKLAAFYKKYEVEKVGILKWEDQQIHSLPQDFADMLGWKELTDKTKKFYNSLPDSTKSNTIIYCRNYGQAGSLSFYANDENFKSKVISDNGSFLLWIPNQLRFKHLIFIGSSMPGTDDEVFQHFQSVSIIDSITNNYSRQLGDKIIFFQNIDSAGLMAAQKGLKEMKAEFGR